MIIKIRKRDGREVPFNMEKISNAIFKAAQAVGGQDYETSMILAEKVTNLLSTKFIEGIPTVEDIQDLVEKTLIEEGHAKTAKEFILYRAKRTRIREMNTGLMQNFEGLTFNNELDESKINSPIGILYQFGLEAVNKFHDLFVLSHEDSLAHNSGQIHIHKLEYMTLMTETCNIDILDLIEEGFRIDGSPVERPITIMDYIVFILIVIQNNQNDQYGEQALCNFDTIMGQAIGENYIKYYRDYLRLNLQKILGPVGLEENIDNIYQVLLEEYNLKPSLDQDLYTIKEEEYLRELLPGLDGIGLLQKKSRYEGLKLIKKELRQAYRHLFKLLNSLKPRLGSKFLKTSLAFGSDNKEEARLASEVLLDFIIDEGASYNNPKLIFKLKKSINTDPENKAYYIFKKALKAILLGRDISFSFLDSPGNIDRSKGGQGGTEVFYSSSGSRIRENLFNKEDQRVFGRGNIGSVTINLVRIALENRQDPEGFYRSLNLTLDLVIALLVEKFELLAPRYKAYYPSLMGQGIWKGSRKLGSYEEIREVLKNGKLSVGFIGLKEALDLLFSPIEKTKDYGDLGLEILGHMKKVLDDISFQYSLSFDLMATYDEEVSKKFIIEDRRIYGNIGGITDKKLYNLGFDMDPNLNYLDKLSLEENFHEITTGGHRTSLFIETKDFNIVEEVALNMIKSKIGYGQIIVR